MTLDKCELVREVKPSATNEFQNPDGALLVYRLNAVGQLPKQITLALRGTTNGWVIGLRDIRGRSLMPVAFTNCMTTDQIEVYTCDLNDDGQIDFIINIWSGGCGLPPQDIAPALYARCPNIFRQLIQTTLGPSSSQNFNIHKF